MPTDAYSMLLPLVGIILLIFLAYFAAGWVAKRYQFRIKTGKHIRIRERAMLGQDKFLTLVELNGKIYFIAMTGQRIEVIDTLPADSLPELETEELKSDFGALLTSVMEKQHWLKDKLTKKEDDRDEDKP